MKKCKLCGKELQEGENHHCPERNNEKISYDDDNFLESMIIGAATDSASLGGVLGGNIAGGITGDLFDGDLSD